jgi:hypothetical protein
LLPGAKAFGQQISSFNLNFTNYTAESFYARSVKKRNHYFIFLCLHKISAVNPSEKVFRVGGNRESFKVFSAFKKDL